MVAGRLPQIVLQMTPRLFFGSIKTTHMPLRNTFSPVGGLPTKLDKSILLTFAFALVSDFTL